LRHLREGAIEIRDGFHTDGQKLNIEFPSGSFGGLKDEPVCGCGGRVEDAEPRRARHGCFQDLEDSIGHPRGGVNDVINAIAGACLLARKTPSEARKVVAMPKRQAVSPRTLNRLRPRGRVEALRAEPRDSLYASVGWVGWVSARGRFA